MRRREFVTLFGSAAAAWPLAARAQRPSKVVTIGLLGSGTAAAQSTWTAAFVQRMRELGWIEGHNLTIECWPGPYTCQPRGRHKVCSRGPMAERAAVLL